MRTTLLTATALLLGMTVTGAASAHAPAHHADHGYTRTYHGSRPYYVDHGHHNAHGYYFAGADHPHWAYRVWCPEFRRYNYWDADLRCFYYFNPQLNGYYPCP